MFAPMIWLLFSAFQSDLAGQPAEGLTYEFFQKARLLWAEACRSHGLNPQEEPFWIGQEQSIVVTLEGHYRVPWSTREIKLERELWCRSDGGALHQTLRRKRGERQIEDVVALVGERALRRDLEQSDWTSVDSDSEDWAEWQRELLDKSPIALLHQIAARLPNLLWLGSVDEGERRVLSYADQQGRQLVLFFDRQSNLLRKVEVLHHHAGFGDQLAVIQFDDYRRVQGLMLPFRIEERRYEGGVGYSSITEVKAYHLFQSPRSLDFGELAEGLKPMTRELLWHDLGEGLYSVTLSDHKARSFVVAFSDYSVILDAVGDSSASEQLLNLVQEKLPQQPVRYVAISHFHPFYTWGIRPYIHRGIKIMATPAVMPYLERLAANPHLTLPDALSLEPQTLQLRPVINRLELRDEQQHLELYDIGEASHHTSEYLVYYLPKLKLLIQGDLVWMRADQPQYKANPRAKGLMEAIEARQLEVETVGTTILHENFLNWVPIALLRDAVEGKNALFRANGHKNPERHQLLHPVWPTGSSRLQP